MTKQPEKTEDEELSPYEEMVKERLNLLKEGFDEFPAPDDGDGSKLPSFIMMHIAQIYTRLDLALAEIEELKDVNEYGDGTEVSEEEYQKIADEVAIDETRFKLQQCRDQLARELDRAPSNEELADEMGLELELIEKLSA